MNLKDLLIVANNFIEEVETLQRKCSKLENEVIMLQKEKGSVIKALREDRIKDVKNYFGII